MKILSVEEAQKHGLETKGKVYLQLFLASRLPASNAMNPATGELQPFKLNSESFPNIIVSAIGKPYIVPDNPNRHVYYDKLDDIFNNQKKFALGEIIKVWDNTSTGNANAIIDVFPEYHEQVEKMEIPEFTSPMLEVIEGPLNDIKKANFIHLQGVNSPGYPPEISRIKSVCKNGLEECMRELRTVAAAGKLKETRHFLLRNEQELNNNMSQTTQTTQMTIEERIGALETSIKDLADKVSTIKVAAGGKDALGSAQVTITKDEEAHKKLSQVEKELETLKKERDAEKELAKQAKEKEAHEKRQKLATEIAEAKLKLKMIPLKSRDEEIKRLFEMKKEGSEEFVDLSPIHSELTKQIKSIVGASGNRVSLEFVEYGDSESTKPQDLFGITQEIGSR